jgi:hypothetical protein
MQSVNMWEHGRRTDDYRGKNRILGENLSLARQYIYTDALWNAEGFKDKAPDPGYADWLRSLPASTVTWFARGQYDRLLITIRDGDRVIGLPVINGGSGEHMTNPYFPVPFSPGMLSGVADGTAPNLTPRFTLADGSVLMPLAYFKEAEVKSEGRQVTARWRQDQLDRMGQKAPVADGRLKVSTTYVLAPGRITRTDEYSPAMGPVDLASIAMEFGSYSSGSVVEGGRTRFTSGDVTGLTVEGLDGCKAQPFAKASDAATPVGALNSRIVCAGGPRRVTGPFKISWTMTYR